MFLASVTWLRYCSWNKINVSPNFERQKAISQPARTDETRYSLDRHFIRQFMITSFVNLLVSWLVGPLSPVDHKGFHQGWTQTSLYLQFIYFTSHHTTSLFGFFCLFIFRRHSTREPASSRVTYFILRAYTRTKKSGEILVKMQLNEPEG